MIKFYLGLKDMRLYACRDLFPPGKVSFIRDQEIPPAKQWCNFRECKEILREMICINPVNFFMHSPVVATQKRFNMPKGICNLKDGKRTTPTRNMGKKS
jgi:hypothetical protein